ncbi:MAG: hypothetical protein WC091_05615 [Sulfuricellaceae bacterium]
MNTLTNSCRIVSVLVFVLVALTSHAATPQLALGAQHSLVLKADGSVWAFGENASGRLGDGTETGRAYPVRVVGLDNAVQVVAGYYHSVALKADGTVYCWGENLSGQLGLGDVAPRLKPAQVMLPAKATLIAAGEAHTVAVLEDGSVWAWGDNRSGQVGNGAGEMQSVPLKVGGLPPVGPLLVAAGSGHTLTLTRGHTLWGWGDNADNQISAGMARTLAEGTKLNPDMEAFATIAAAGQGSVAADSQGRVFAWGNGKYALPRASQVDGLPAIRQVAVSAVGTYLALDREGGVWIWGSDYGGLLGLGANGNAKKPVKHPTLPKVVSAALGPYHVGVINEDGAVYLWGEGRRGQLGDGEALTRLTPQPLGAFGAVAYAVAGAGRTLVLTRSGGALGAGDSSHRELGTADKHNPLPLSVGADQKVWRGAALGGLHTLLLDDAGSAYALGDNGFGQLGATPVAPGGMVAVPGLPPVAQLAAGGGGAFSLALTRDGEVWAWGDSSAGQLARENTNTPGAPARIAGLSKVAAVATGSLHGVALLEDGTVRAWGDNTLGQLGDRTVTRRFDPVTVGGLSDVAGIAGGYFHTLAWKRDGTVWAWGHNADGQLGDGTRVSRNNGAIPVPGLQKIISVAVGSGHSLALDSEGHVYAWGNNRQGQLGIGDMDTRLTPTLIGRYPGAKGVAAGAWHSLLILEDGSLLGWGDDSTGALGDGALLDARSTPAALLAPDGKGRFTVGGLGDESLPDFFTRTTSKTDDAGNTSLTVTLIPAEADRGKAANLYLAARRQGVWFAHTGKNWHAWENSPLPAYGKVVLASRHTILPAQKMNLIALPSVELFVGYGETPEQMVVRKTWEQVYRQADGM